MGNVAADGAAVPNLRVANAAGRFRQQRVGMLQVMGCGDFPVGGQRADADGIALHADALQFGQAANVNEGRRPGQAEPHQGDEAVTASQQPGVGMGRQQLDGCGRRTGLIILELRREHSCSSR